MLRSLTRSVFAAASVLGLVSTASAADVARKAPSYAPAYSAPINWSNFYVGANLGYGWGKNQTLAPYNFINNLDVGASAKGVTLGGVVGYRHQINSFTVGAFADFDLAVMKGSGDSSAVAFGFVPLSSTINTSFDRLWSVRGEFGWAPISNVLLTGNVGFGGVHGNVRGNGSIFTTQVATFDQSVSKTGLVYGAGLAYKLPNDWFVSAGWTRYQMGSADVVMTTPFVGTQIGSVNMNVDVVKVGLNHKLNLF